MTENVNFPKMQMKLSLFNQIEQTSAYNIDILVGDIGGYFGLFHGYAISQIPSTLLACQFIEFILSFHQQSEYIVNKTTYANYSLTNCC